ncbi:MAG: serine/threonine protein kinase, partial [Kiritimatiellia bacterium]
MSSVLRVPGYTLRRMVGEGATAAVYKARAIAENRDVAIKVLNPENAGDADAIKQFHLEFLAMSSLRHRNIVRVFAEGEVDGRPYFIMEYVGGYSVAEWLSRKGRLQEKDVLLIAESCMMALHYAWSTAGLVHADLKPANVLVDTDGTIKLTDFSGIRRGECAPRLIKDRLIGIPAYMSPEQWLALSGLDARSDMYALGAMMYHLACGQLLCGERLADPNQPFVPPESTSVRTARPDFSRASSQLIERLLAIPVDKRFPDWDAALRALEDALPRSMRLDTGDASGLPTNTAPHPPGGADCESGTGAKKTAMPKALLALLGLLIPLGIIMMAFQAWWRDREPLPAEPADMSEQTVSVEAMTGSIPEQTEPPAPLVPLEPPPASSIPDAVRPESTKDRHVPPRPTAVSMDDRTQDTPTGQLDYLEVMNDTFQLARRRQFGEARGLLELRLKTSPRLAEPYTRRLEEAVRLLEQADAAFMGLAENPVVLSDFELEHTHNHLGRIAALQGEQLHVVH